MEEIRSISNGEARSHLQHHLSAIQPTLFGGAVPVVDPQDSAEEPPSNPRKAQIDRAHSKGDPMVMKRYREVLIKTAREVGVFGAWHVTTRFIEQYGELGETDRKAIGRLWQEAIRLGDIVAVGTAKRPNGNLAALYRMNK